MAKDVLNKKPVSDSIADEIINGTYKPHVNILTSLLLDFLIWVHAASIVMCTWVIFNCIQSTKGSLFIKVGLVLLCVITIAFSVYRMKQEYNEIVGK
jgi:hypothetical protein